ncbi:hypothetical protein I7I51_01281 [Histoplasma capsulatum]|uniref:Thiolase N-terminal domain-containing protein n=1 Tax=Ajellomyces capsulatus TaxID=5037 RepID=A0A8A1MCJ1_AJECA|nr:hypothetical protein I7I51_01281 [Histoplasma capsulatum]
MASAEQRLSSVITLAIRTPLTKARKGALKDTHPDDLLIALLTAVRERSNLDPSLVEDVCVGNVSAPSAPYASRSAVLVAGYPMDDFAARSHQRAELAQKSGWVVDEIAPIRVKVKDPKTGQVREVVADRDDGIRYGTTAESLAKVRPAFSQWKPGRTTGGNASQITGGAAAVLMMKRSRALELEQPIIIKFCGATVACLEPRIMGIGPTLAIPKMMKKLNL